jgi:hypothetical protein
VKASKPVIPAAGAEKALRLPAMAMDIAKQEQDGGRIWIPAVRIGTECLLAGIVWNWRAPQSSRRRSP